jgi:hypothetical protein
MITFVQVPPWTWAWFLLPTKHLKLRVQAKIHLFITQSMIPFLELADRGRMVQFAGTTTNHSWLVVTSSCIQYLWSSITVLGAEIQALWITRFCSGMLQSFWIYPSLETATYDNVMWLWWRHDIHTDTRIMSRSSNLISKIKKFFPCVSCSIHISPDVNRNRKVHLVIVLWYCESWQCAVLWVGFHMVSMIQNIHI